MHLRYFGDSYDIVKRFLLAALSPLGPWSIHAMFVDPVERRDAESFETFIGAPLCTRQIVGTTANRIESLIQCTSAGHLLVDPDTGVRMTATPAKASPRHLYAPELLELVAARPSFLTAVFDQSLKRAPVSPQLESKLAYFAARGVAGFAYSSHASFLFLTRDRALATRAVDALRSTGLPHERLVQGA